MSAFLYGVGLQWKIDLRSHTALIAFYAVPLLFLIIFGGIFSSIMPDGQETLLPMMTVFAVSMGGLMGLPPSISAMYSREIRNTYQVNGVPIWQGLIQADLAAFLHLMILAAMVYVLTPLLFDAALPEGIAPSLSGTLLLIANTVGIANVIGLGIRDVSVVSAVSTAVFLPSILLSGIMVPRDLLPEILQELGSFFPASWAYALLSSNHVASADVWPLVLILAACAAASAILIRRLRRRL